MTAPIFHLGSPTGWRRLPPALLPGRTGLDPDPDRDTTSDTNMDSGDEDRHNKSRRRAAAATATAIEQWDLDSAGCFSGCSLVDEQGVPTILYTGVRLRPGVPPDVPGMYGTVSQLAEERQLLARAADPDDPDLITWVKEPRPWMDAPPPGMPYNCFRDPFLLSRPLRNQPAGHHPALEKGVGGQVVGGVSVVDDDFSAGCGGGNAGGGGGGGGGCDRWVVMVGSGRGDYRAAASRGCVLTYSTQRLSSRDWRFEGVLAESPSAQAGAVWECPVLAWLPRRGRNRSSSGRRGGGSSSDSSSRGSSSSCRDSAVGLLERTATNGRRGNQEEEGEDGEGRFPGRVVMWSWLRERHTSPDPPTAPATYAGAISVPRLLTRGSVDLSTTTTTAPAPKRGTTGGIAAETATGRTRGSAVTWRLHQEPLPELCRLRRGDPEGPTGLDGAVLEAGAEPVALHLDVELRISPLSYDGPADGSTAPYNVSWMLSIEPGSSDSGRGGGGGDSPSVGGDAAVLSYDFATCQLAATVGPADAVRHLRQQQQLQGSVRVDGTRTAVQLPASPPAAGTAAKAAAAAAAADAAAAAGAAPAADAAPPGEVAAEAEAAAAATAAAGASSPLPPCCRRVGGVLSGLGPADADVDADVDGGGGGGGGPPLVGPDVAFWDPSADDAWLDPNFPVYHTFIRSNLNTVGPANATTILLRLHRGITVGLFNNPNHRRQLENLGLRPDTAFGCAAAFLFFPNAETRALAAEDPDLHSLMLDEHVIKIGIQIRLGDDKILAQIAATGGTQGSPGDAGGKVADKDVALDPDTERRVEGYFECAQQLAESVELLSGPDAPRQQRQQQQGQNATRPGAPPLPTPHPNAADHPPLRIQYYLMTDTLAIRQLAQRRFGTQLLTMRATAVQFFRNVTPDGLRRTALEHWYFSRSHHHVITAQSGMGRTAAFMGLRPGPSVFSMDADVGGVRVWGRGCAVWDADKPMDVYGIWSGV
ncbi:hypothetical protein VOLCADRAFT_89210 [Volvox carteri f. nagariensis]|uniref:Uncharacterized protein n=1 Tax=Volvox carteri f. nagariensis TaxID=3068 RepID=D8TR34_VOLCA|nr:uncharacterized protein VOLCADRAFT_89210 [Volvox carteri f. nagariensis]EFJ50131.1 hypothetical protein VOLCADRAFT_89210 [Volvox carteri f. nagariensis]|eukprot:XP_002948751.1 hypothetical protein VOLCADRAFT_89210 [Volvox carteri f. nagariensis]